MKMKLVALLIIILSILLLKNCFHEAIDQKEFQEPTENSAQSEDYLMSSNTYFIGRWKLSYLDIVNYMYDNNGKPIFDIFKQADTYAFEIANEQLLIEDTFPVINNQFNGKDFVMEIDNKVLYLVITGAVEDKDNWTGVFEYFTENRELVSKCKVRAIRDN